VPALIENLAIEAGFGGSAIFFPMPRLSLLRLWGLGHILGLEILKNNHFVIGIADDCVTSLVAEISTDIGHLKMGATDLTLNLTAPI
jgi:hypothetical protein